MSCAYSVFITSGGGILFRLAVGAAILAAGWGLRMVLGGLTVLVQETRIVMHLGSVGLVRKMVPFDSIVSLESVRYRPLVEFGSSAAGECAVRARRRPGPPAAIARS